MEDNTAGVHTLSLEQRSACSERARFDKIDYVHVVDSLSQARKEIEGGITWVGALAT